MSYAFVLLVLDPAEWGTVWDWTVGVAIGLVTAAFAGLAWWQARQATLWARRAALAEERANAIAEAQHLPEFEVWLASVGGGKGSTIEFDLTGGAGAIWFWGAAVTAAVLHPHPEVAAMMETALERAEDSPPDVDPIRAEPAIIGWTEVEPWDDYPDIPSRMVPRGDSLAMPDPTQLIHQGWELGEKSLMLVSIDYSVTPDGEIHTLEKVDVDVSRLARISDGSIPNEK